MNVWIGWIACLRGRSGLDPEVRDYLEAISEYREFLARIVDLVAFLIPQYIREGKSYLTVAVGCTGGRHRSVAMAEAVSRALCDRGYAVKASHRDLDKE